MHHGFPHPGIGSLFALFIPLLLILLFSPQLNAERMVLHRFYSEQREPEIEELLYLAAGVELTGAGFSSSRSAEDSDYTLHTRYRREGDNLVVRYNLYRKASRSGSDESLAETGVNLRINHYFDLIIASTVNHLLSIAGIERHPSPEARIEGILPDYPESGGAETALREKPSEQDVDGKAEDATRHSPSPEGSAEPAQYRSGLDSGAGFYATVGFGPLMLLGEITEYFHYGLAGTVSAGLEWTSPERSWQLGTRFNLIRVIKDTRTRGPSLYFSTAGVNLVLGSGSGNLNRFYAGITGGAAFIRVADSDGSMTKTVPYAKGNIAMRVPLGGRLYLQPDLALLLIFDDDLLINGFLPSLSAGLEF